MTIADIKKNAQERMSKSIETLRADLAKVRTGRAHVGILDHITVEYYGQPTALSQVANVTPLAGRSTKLRRREPPSAAEIAPDHRPRRGREARERPHLPADRQR